MDCPNSRCHKNPPSHLQSNANVWGGFAIRHKRGNEPNQYPQANKHPSPYRHSSAHRYPLATATHGYASADRRLQPRFPHSGSCRYEQPQASGRVFNFDVSTAAPHG